MRTSAVCLAGLALALCPASSVAAGRPSLSQLSGAYDGAITSTGAAFDADGSRFATFSDAAGHLIALDAQTNRRSTVALDPCGSSVFHPVGLGRGRLITFCYGGPIGLGPEQFRVIDLATHADRLVDFSPPPNDGPFNDLTTPVAVGSDWADLAGGQPPSFDHGLFNLDDGTVRPPPILGPNEYRDLDSPQLTHRVCAPVTTTNFELPSAGNGGEISVGVVGLERPWAVLEVDTNTGGGSSGGMISDAELYAWRCGAAKPIRLGQVAPGREQVGAGIVTWVDGRGRVNADDLSTGRQWTWPTARSGTSGAKVGYAEALHTANRVYAVPQVTPATSSGPQQIFTASLAGLRRPARAKP